jgi:O-antigen ligase
VRRFGFRGLLIGAILALPVLMFGGREGEEADSSSAERAELLYGGIDIMREHILFGVGVGQFQEHTWNHLTAHNSYLLAAAEMGIPGSIFWSMLVYINVKIPWVVARRPPPGLDPRIIPFAYALVISYAGILVGIFFLSFCYKQMLFIYFGLSGALYGVAKQAWPQFKVGTSFGELVKVTALDFALLAFIFVYSRFKATG